MSICGLYNIVIGNIKVKTHIKHIGIIIIGKKNYGRKEQINKKMWLKCECAKSDGLWIL